MDEETEEAIAAAMPAVLRGEIEPPWKCVVDGPPVVVDLSPPPDGHDPIDGVICWLDQDGVLQTRPIAPREDDAEPLEGEG